MPERRRIPDDSQPTQPYLPPELPDSQDTRQQTIQDQTRIITPVKDIRLNPNQLVEKPKHDQIPPRKGSSSTHNSPFWLPIWSVLLMLMGVVGSVACIIVAILALGGRTASIAPPDFVVLSAVPSTIPLVTIPSLLTTPTVPPQFQSVDGSNLILSGPTLAPIIYTATPTQPPRITVGSIVAIVGDQGINIRNNPGTENGLVIVANPGEEFTVVDGPRQSNGLNWWELTDAARGITGWAAENDGTTDLFQVKTP